MDPGACQAFLGAHRVGIMALAHGGQAYAVPLFYAYDGHALYFHSRPGEKDDFLEHTREGCFVVMEVHGDDDWTSVQARGRVERIHTNSEAERAFHAISGNPFPPEFGLDAHGQPRHSGRGAYLWQMRPGHVTGRTSRSAVRAK